jgi:O-antigen ligase
MRPLKKLVSCFVSLYTLLVLVLFLSVADQPLGRFGYLPINPTLCALLMVLPFGAWACVTDMMLHSHRRFLSTLISNSAPYAAFFFIVASSLLYSILPGAFWNEGGKWIFLVSYGFCIALLALFIPQARSFSKLFPLYALAALTLLLWSIYLDITYPGTFATLGQRAAGFPGNANFAALVSVMICAAALDYTSQNGQWKNILLLIITGTIIVTTMSRSGMLNFALLLGIFFYARLAASGWSAREVIKLVSITAIMIGICATLAVTAVATGTISEHSRLGRLLSNKQVDDGSAASRLFAVRESLRLINESPLIGHGTGHARTMAELPHNLYLQQWVNNGIAGILGIMTFFGVSLATFTKRRYRPGQALILVSIVGGVFSHNILDQRCFLLLFGIMLGLSSQTTKPAIARYSSAALRAPYLVRA